MIKMRYRLALDLGSTSLGWVIVLLKEIAGEWRPAAIIKAGVRIFSDGRDPQKGASLAVHRREKRAMRRRRDRLLKRKHRMMALLLKHGFFPVDVDERRTLELLDPYKLRAKGLNEALTPAEFARALFHINQRRGFKSNRKTDKKDNDSSALKTAICNLRQAIAAYPRDVDGKPLKPGQFSLLDWVNRKLPETENGLPRTVGELLRKRSQSGDGVRARYRETPVVKEDGKKRIDKSYDLYIDRAMIEAEFDALWAKQADLNPAAYTEAARAELKDCLLHQRPLKPVKPGRCTLEPDEERAPLALPSQQRFRIYQEVNNLRVLGEGLRDEPLTLEQRNQIVSLLEKPRKDKKTAHEVSFDQIRVALGLSGTVKFNIEDQKRTSLKGNSTSAILSKKEYFGSVWFDWSERQQDAIVRQLVNQQSLGRLIKRLMKYCLVDEARAEAIANAGLPDGYGSLSAKALARILPELSNEVTTYDKAVQAAGYEHHSRLNAYGEIPGMTFDTGHERINRSTGEIEKLHAHCKLPYYGEYLQRHVGFGTGKPEDPPEKRYGKIANPTVHIGLNQVRVVVNALIKRYGHPSEVIVEVARELKQSREQRQDEQRRQSDNQKRNDRLRNEAARILEIVPEQVRRADIQKLILWEELSFNVAERYCPYSGVQIGACMVLSEETEIEHILPFSQTLDDSLNNKTLAMRQANRIKGNRTPWQASEDFARQGWKYEDILRRAERMPKNKRYRFGMDGYEKWLREDNDFLARALNDTRHLSRVAREYLSLICPQNTRVIPGQMTAMLRAKFGLNDILGLGGEKNRNDHRHHAVDACVIAVTDQGMLQRFAQASARAREKQLDRLVENMPLPWETYYEHVKRAVGNIWVSHKPDHGYEGAMMEATAYGIRKDGSIKQKIKADGSGGREVKNLIRISEPSQPERHGVVEGEPLPYVGYVGGSNYCIEIVRNEKGKWEGEIITTFVAYRRITDEVKRLRIRGFSHEEASRLAVASLRGNMSASGKPIIMRLMKGDTVLIEAEDGKRLLRVVKIDPSTNIVFSEINEAGELQRRHVDGDDHFRYTNLRGGSLQSVKARHVTISPIGELRDPGFKE